jgi:hypothetical protein
VKLAPEHKREGREINDGDFSKGCERIKVWDNAWKKRDKDGLD